MCPTHHSSLKAYWVKKSSLNGALEVYSALQAAFEQLAPLPKNWRSTGSVTFASCGPPPFFLQGFQSLEHLKKLQPEHLQKTEGQKEMLTASCWLPPGFFASVLAARRQFEHSKPSDFQKFAV